MIAVGGPMKADNELPVSPDLCQRPNWLGSGRGHGLSGGIFIALALLSWSGFCCSKPDWDTR